MEEVEDIGHTRLRQFDSSSAATRGGARAVDAHSRREKRTAQDGAFGDCEVSPEGGGGSGGQKSDNPGRWWVPLNDHLLGGDDHDDEDNNT